MKIIRKDCCEEPELRLRELQPNDCFELICDEPHQPKPGYCEGPMIVLHQDAKYLKINNRQNAVLVYCFATNSIHYRANDLSVKRVSCAMCVSPVK